MAKVATAINKLTHFQNTKEISKMKTLVKRIAVLTLAFALAVAGASSFVNMNEGVQVVHDGPNSLGDYVHK